jgi:hypothetical protein
MVAATEAKKDKTAMKTLKNSNILARVEAKWYKARKCYRVWVPARLSEKRKDWRRFFETKEQPEKFILRQSAAVPLNSLNSRSKKSISSG